MWRCDQILPSVLNPPKTLLAWIYLRVCVSAVLAETFSGHRVLFSLQEQTEGKGWCSKFSTDFHFPYVGSVEIGPALTHSVSPLFFALLKM